MCINNECYIFRWRARVHITHCTLETMRAVLTCGAMWAFPNHVLATWASQRNTSVSCFSFNMLIHFQFSSAAYSVIFFSFYSLVLWKPDLRLWALIFCISNSVSFLCSQMCLHSCSPSINKKDVCTAGKRILIYLWPELWGMEWPDGHYLNPMWLQTFWSSERDNWTTKPTLKFASLIYRL